MAWFRNLALVYLFAATIVVAQEPAKTNLVLTVADPSGAVIPNAATHVESSDHSISFGTKTDNTGQVTFELMPGSYTIKVNSKGFATSTSQVQVNSAPTQEMKVALKIASSSGPLVVRSMPQINVDQVSITAYIPPVELIPFPLPDKKLQSHRFSLWDCAININCTT